MFKSFWSLNNFTIEPKQKMISLRHLAVDAHIKSGVKCDCNNVEIMDVIFEVDQLREKVLMKLSDLEDDFQFTQKVKNSKPQNFSEKFWNLNDQISVELFDKFNYSDAITTDEEVEWKEYFHCLYDAIIPDEGEFYNHSVWDALPEPPKDLDTNYPCWYMIQNIRRNFDQLKIEGEKVDTPFQIINTQTQYGKCLLELKKEILKEKKTLDMYNRIIEWSMY